MLKRREPTTDPQEIKHTHCNMMTHIAFVVLLSQALLCSAFAPSNIGTGLGRANSQLRSSFQSPRSQKLALGSLQMGLPSFNLRKTANLRKNPKSAVKAASIAAPPIATEETQRLPGLSQGQEKAKGNVSDRQVDVQVWTSEDKKQCVFSFDGESEGTLLYVLEGGYYRFQGYIVYREGKSAFASDFSEFDGCFSNSDFVRPPLLMFDDPLPAMSAGHLALFARHFLKPHHVREIKRARDILMEPLGPGEKQPQPGDRIVLSNGYVTRMEMHVTDEMTWKPTRLVSTHSTNRRDRFGQMQPRVIDWDMASPGAEFQDAVVQESGAVLSSRKLHQLLELQMGMIDFEATSELILGGIAASYNGQSDSFNSMAKQVEISVRRLCLDYLATAAELVKFNVELEMERSAHAAMSVASKLRMPAAPQTWRQRR